MEATNTRTAPQPPGASPRTSWPKVVQRLAIWLAFVLVIYLARDFFFTAFMTFLFSYLTLAVVDFGMRRLAKDRESPGLRRLLTVGVFVAVPLILLAVGMLVGPRLLDQGEHAVAWLSHVEPETEIAHVCEGFVAPAEFREHFGGPSDPRYQKGLEEFRQSGERHVDAYNQFPALEAWVEGGYRRQFLEAERSKANSRLAKEGTSSQGFHQWFVTKKYPALQAQSAKQAPDKGRPPTAIDPLVRASATASPEQLLLQVRRDPAVLAASRQEWIKNAVENDLAAALNSSAYHEGLRRHYDDLRAQSPKTIPYTFDQYLDLQKVRPEGAVAFGKAVEKINPTAAEDDDARTRADFEAAKKRELFQEWWSTSAVGKFVRRHVNAGSGEGGVDYIEKIVTSFLNVPVDLATALLLSLFICIDFPRLKRGVQSLRETWLRDVYDELAPVLYHQTQLIGRAMYAQGLIALCNAVTLFLLLSWLGIEHTVLLCLAVFVLCLVPTLGTFIAWILIAAMALIQPGGGLMLALKATGAVLVVVALETFVFSPRILGRMMEVHPVLLIALLPLAQYFFGIWGLLLATPVAVYVIHVVILRHGLPGSGEAHKAAAGEPTSGAVPSEVRPNDIPPPAKEKVETARAAEH